MKDALANGAVGVWRIPAMELPGAPVLNAEEKARAERLRNEGARIRFVVGRVALRMILGELLRVGPETLEFGAGLHGKPLLLNASDDLRFNIAHSGAKALIAVANAREVGVDIETIEQDRDLEGIAHRYFRPEEYAALARLSDAERPAIFTRVWTRKEAYLKARGTGIRGGLASFAVTIPPEPPRLASDPAGAAWSFADIDCGDGYAAAICAAGRPLQLLLREWDWSPGPR